MSEWREKAEELWENWNDKYWRADHPEVTMTVVSILTGIVGLLFAVLQAKLTARYQGGSNG